jgi:hypothetical protein
MRILGVSICGMLFLAGCGTSGLTALAKAETDYLDSLQRTMPTLVTAHEVALKGFLTQAQTAEEEAQGDDQAEALKGVLDDAMRAAALNPAQPTRDSIRDTLRQLMKYDRDQAVLMQAAQDARRVKSAAVLKALTDLSAAVPALAADQRAIENYLEASHGLLSFGGVSVTEMPSNFDDLLARLKAVNGVLEEQFGRANSIFEAARKAVAEGDKR